MLRHLMPHGGVAVAVVLLMMAATAVSLVPPLMARRIIDTAIPRRDIHLAWVLAGGMAFSPIFGGLLSVAQNYLSALVAQRIMHRLRVEMYARLQAQSLAFFLSRRAGELTSRLENDVGAIQNVVVNTWVSLATNILT